MCVHAQLLVSRVRLFATPRTVASQAPLSMGLLQTRTLEWVAFPPPGDLPNPGTEPTSAALQVDSLPLVPPVKPNRSINRLL